MSFAVRMYFLYRFESHADIIAIFFHDEIDGFVVAGFGGFAFPKKLSVTKLAEHLGFGDSVRFVVEPPLEIFESVGNDRGAYGQASHEQSETKTKSASRGPHEPLPLFVQNLFQDDAALLRLPNLVWVFVLVQLQKLLICVQSGLRLLQFIVTES